MSLMNSTTAYAHPRSKTDLGHTDPLATDAGSSLGDVSLATAVSSSEELLLHFDDLPVILLDEDVYQDLRLSKSQAEDEDGDDGAAGIEAYPNRSRRFAGVLQTAITAFRAIPALQIPWVSGLLATTCALLVSLSVFQCVVLFRDASAQSLPSPVLMETSSTYRDTETTPTLAAIGAVSSGTTETITPFALLASAFTGRDWHTAETAPEPGATEELPNASPESSGDDLNLKHLHARLQDDRSCRVCHDTQENSRPETVQTGLPLEPEGLNTPVRVDTDETKNDDEPVTLSPAEAKGFVAYRRS